MRKKKETILELPEKISVKEVDDGLVEIIEKGKPKYSVKNHKEGEGIKISSGPYRKPYMRVTLLNFYSEKQGDFQINLNGEEDLYFLRKGDRLTFGDSIKLEFLVSDSDIFKTENTIKISYRIPRGHKIANI